MNLDGIARPYSKAVFDLAKEQNALTHWMESVEMLVSVVEDKDFQSFINSPSTAKDKIVEVIMGIFSEKSPKLFQSFVEVLIENNRLMVVPALYSQLVKAASLEDKVRQAEIRVACDISDVQIKELSEALEKRYDCKIELNVLKDSNILGGAIIVMDDSTVFDGSLSTRLETLEYLLSS